MSSDDKDTPDDSEGAVPSGEPGRELSSDDGADAGAGSGAEDGSPPREHDGGTSTERDDAAKAESAAAGDAGDGRSLEAFVAASAAAARADAEPDDGSSLWGDDDSPDDDPGYAEVRRSSPGWAISKWVLSAVVAAAVIVLSFIMIPRLFTPDGTEQTADEAGPSEPVAAQPTTAAPVVTYPDAVLATGPTHYWRFEMQSAGADSAGGATLEVGSGAAILGSSAYKGGMGAIDCSGTAQSRALSSTPETPAGDFSIEVWINTVTDQGGPIVTFGNKPSGTSSKLDRVMYMATNGKVYFGTQAKKREFVVSELPVNDGTWRHVVGTMSTGAGLTMYVDGQPVATEKDGIATGDFEGYWKICGDNTAGWVGNSGRPAFTGTVDDVAIYPKALTADEVLEHYETAKGI